MRKTNLLSTALLAGASALACDHTTGHTYSEADGGPGAESPDGAPTRIRDPGNSGPGPNRSTPKTAADGGAGPGSDPPVFAASGAPCVLSADCESGLYCDLGECYQECNVDAPCDSGKTCSPRGRCLGKGEADMDPAPAVARAGTVRGDPSTIELTERDEVLHLHLSADSKNEVRYRVEVNAPYLSIPVARGTFREETTLTLPIDASALSGRELSGSVRVVTNLGEVMFSAPMKVGVTGTYQGTLSYGGIPGGPDIGTTHVGVDIVEKNGDVAIRFVPERSLLFPSFDDGRTSVSGKGSFTYTEGLRVGLRQVLPAGFAGEDDWFGRPIGRDIRLDLVAGARGALEGTFHEKIHGLMSEPIELVGRAHFERIRCASGSDCEPRADLAAVIPALPELDPAKEPDINDVFPGWNLSGCKTDPGTGREATIFASQFVDLKAQPFRDRLSGDWPLTRSDPLGDLANECESDLRLTETVEKPSCAQVAPIACYASMLVAIGAGSDAFDTFGSMYAHTLEAPLFVAQNDIVRAMKESFVSGPRRELEFFEHAKSMLRGPATWVLQPSMLEYLRQVDPKFQPGKDEAGTTLAGRTLGRLMLMRSTIDAEIGRIEMAARTGSDGDRRLAAQKQGLQSLLEAAVLYGIGSQWQTPPPELGTTFVDVLTPRDAGFTAILQGARVLGVPDGVIPNAYDRVRKPTSFERLLEIANETVESSTRDETEFISQNRDFEDNQERLNSELEQVNASYESQVRAACGNAFDLDKADWNACGEKSGAVASKLEDIQLAIARMQSAQARIQNKHQAIVIEQERLAKVVGVREAAIAFTSKTGETLQAIDRSMAILNGMEKALAIAAQASLWNGGAPLAEAVGAFAIENAKGELEVERQQAQTLQDMKMQESNLMVEQIDSAATVKGLLVDMAQASLEAREDVIAVLGARIEAENALADAKRALLLRARALQRIGNSTLRDPTARLLESRAALNAMGSRAAAQTSLLKAGRGLEYYLNRPIREALGNAVLNAHGAKQQTQLYHCMLDIFNQSAIALPQTQSYVTEVSVRKRLGINGSRKDDVTGEVLTAGAQFRQLLLKNENLDGGGGVGIDLTTTLDPGNGLWSSNVCDDRISQIEAQLVGDFLGDNEAEVYLDLQGGGVLRRCDGDGLASWSTSGHAVIQAGVNTFGMAPTANDSLNGLSVASSKWRVQIPGGSAAPANADLDLSRIEDIVLRIHHEARPIPENPQPIAFDCLAAIGGG
jgi:hypothetical protein